MFRKRIQNRKESMNKENTTDELKDYYNVRALIYHPDTNTWNIETADNKIIESNAHSINLTGSDINQVISAGGTSIKMYFRDVINLEERKAGYGLPVYLAKKYPGS